MTLSLADENPTLSGSAVRAGDILQGWADDPGSVPRDDVAFWQDLNDGLMRSRDPDKHTGMIRMLVAQRDPASRMDGFGKMFAPWYRQRARGGRLVLVHRPGTIRTVTGLISFTNRKFAYKMAVQTKATHMLVAKVDIDDIIGFGVMTAGVAVAALPEDIHTQIRIDDLWIAEEPARGKEATDAQV